jgi:hypothetical protein
MEGLRLDREGVACQRDVLQRHLRGCTCIRQQGLGHGLHESTMHKVTVAAG